MYYVPRIVALLVGGGLAAMLIWQRQSLESVAVVGIITAVVATRV